MILLELSLDDILRALVPAIYETLIMVGVSSLATVVLGLPLGVVLFAVTGRTRVPATAPDAGASASAEPGGQAAGSVGAGI